jgi:squalene-associated FAD-dependent desaturase
MPRPDVIVVGAGFAGLSAAVRLVERGARVLVIEERRRLGGRATAFADPATGEVVDNGQHAVFGCYHETFAFLKTIGAERDIALDDRLDIEIVDRDGRRSRLTTPAWRPPLHLVGGLLRWPALGLGDKIAAVRMGRALRALQSDLGGWNALGSLTASEWLRRMGQTRGITELLWEPLVVAALNQPPEVAAAEPFVRVLTRMFNGTRRDAAIGLPRIPLDALYAEPARRFLESRGSAVRAGAGATLLTEGDRVAGVDVKGERLAADMVIATVPWFGFAAFAAGAPALASIAGAAAMMQPSPIVTVNLWYDRHVTDTNFVGLPGRTFQWVFDKGRIFGAQASHLSLVSSGAEAVVALDNQSLRDIAAREVAAALPAARAARVVSATAVREKRATFSLAPGQPPRPKAETSIRGLFLAGDWTDTGLPATIEGAVQSGHVAAELAVARRGHGTWHPAPHLAPGTRHQART